MSSPFPSEDPNERLGDYEFRMGKTRGKLALAMDLLTDALIVLGQNKVYVHQATGKRKRDNDIEGAIHSLEQVKKLLTHALGDNDQK